MADSGQHLCRRRPGAVVGGCVFLLCGAFWLLQRHLWVARRGDRVDDLDVAVHHRHSAGRGTQCADRQIEPTRNASAPSDRDWWGLVDDARWFVEINVPSIRGPQAMLLYDHPLSSYAQKVKIALREKGVAFEAKLPDSFGTGRQDDAFFAANPRSEVPVLIDGDVKIFDSTIILEYIEERWPDPPLLPKDAAERAFARMTEDVCDTQYEAMNWGFGELLWFKRASGALEEMLRAEAGESDEDHAGLARWAAWRCAMVWRRHVRLGGRGRCADGQPFRSLWLGSSGRQPACALAYASEGAPFGRANLCRIRCGDDAYGGRCRHLQKRRTTTRISRSSPRMDGEVGRCRCCAERATRQKHPLPVAQRIALTKTPRPFCQAADLAADLFGDRGERDGLAAKGAFSRYDLGKNFHVFRMRAQRRLNCLAIDLNKRRFGRAVRSRFRHAVGCEGQCEIDGPA